jgi:hypothetical protein
MRLSPRPLIPAFALVALVGSLACRKNPTATAGLGQPCVQHADCSSAYFCDDLTHTCQAPPHDAASLPDAAAADATAADLASDVAADLAPDLAADVAPDAAMAFSPDELGASLALWLDAAMNVQARSPGVVGTWEDRSAHHHVGTAVGPGPWLVTDASTARPAIRFGLSGGLTTRILIPDHPSLRWGVADFTIAAVAKYRNSPSPQAIPNDYGLLISKPNVDLKPYTGPGLWLNNPWAAWIPGAGGQVTSQILFQISGDADHIATSQAAGYNDDKPHLLMAIRVGRELRVRIDGAAAGVALNPDVMDVSATGYAMALGAHPVGALQQMDGEVFEVVAFTESLPQPRLHALEQYFSRKFALTLAP